jgi:hypothetical protein
MFGEINLFGLAISEIILEILATIILLAYVFDSQLNWTGNAFTFVQSY